MSWLSERLGPNPTVDDLSGRIGSLLVDSRTFRGDDPYQGVADKAGKPFWRGMERTQFVLTHHVPDAPAPEVTFVGDLPAESPRLRRPPVTSTSMSSVPTSRRSAWRPVRSTRSSCASRPPVLLGEGVRLFERPGGTNVELERLNLAHAPQASNIWLRAVR
jgi:hypothetical protein